MLPVSLEKDKFRGDFERLQRTGARTAPVWLHQLRAQAMRGFEALPFPTVRDEDWRFTNVAPILATPFRSANGDGRPGPAIDQILPQGLATLKGNRLVFLNGLYAKELSFQVQSPGEAVIISQAEAISRDLEILRTHLAQQAPYEKDVFTALNTAFVQDGGCVYIPNDVDVTDPIHLLFVYGGGETATVSYPRNLFVLGRGSRATLIESHVGLYGSPTLSNSVTEIVVGEGASLDHYKIQAENDAAFHLATTHVRQARGSHYSNFLLSMGAAIARNNLTVQLAAEGCGCVLNGLYLATGKQHVDNHTTIDHAQPQGTSQELYKGILAGRAKAVFHGKIVVRKDAQKTDAQQTNKNLLLSDDAQVNTTPQLEILADDVKCAHGATVGQLEEDAIFYFKSRGIGDATARRLLTYGFAGDVINRIQSEPIRAPLNRMILSTIAGLGAKESV